MQPTKERIVEAALEALKTVGFAGATSRAIARIGGFNQALVFYHFRTLDNLLLAALDKTSNERLRAYRDTVDGVESLDQLAHVAAELYREDRVSGHMTVVSQMFAGSLTRSELAPALVERVKPWIDLAEETFARVLARTPLEAVAPARELAYAVVTFYVGVNLLTHLDPDRARTDALFERLTDAAALLSALTRA
jgi:AcrR family transcriptional regulator